MNVGGIYLGAVMAWIKVLAVGMERSQQLERNPTCLDLLTCTPLHHPAWPEIAAELMLMNVLLEL